jgi:hypothetical protein
MIHGRQLWHSRKEKTMEFKVIRAEDETAAEAAVNNWIRENPEREIRRISLTVGQSHVIVSFLHVPRNGHVDVTD